MGIVIDYIFQNYVYLIIDFLFSILSLILLFFIRKFKNKSDLYDEYICFLRSLPNLIAEANVAFPFSKSGSKKFDYVVGLVSRRYPSIPLALIQQSVNDILSADKLEGGDDCEKVESQKTEGSQDFCEDSEEDEQVESSSTPNERRYTFIKR